MMWSTQLPAALLVAVYALTANAQSCPGVHIFGARETTVGPGYGSSGALVDRIKSSNPGATSEAITYPACGGQSSCGGVQYGDSARQGTSAVASAVNSFNQRCPNTKIVLVGYSQGGQIMDNAFCGGPDPGSGISNSAIPISAAAQNMVKAVIMMGNPRYQYGIAHQVGTCTQGGFAARPSNFVCPGGSKVKSYCDQEDPYCCKGNSQQHHQQYVQIYGTQALNFVNAALQGGTTNPPASSTNPGTPGPTNNPNPTCQALWGQCGGQGWSGPTCCTQGTCKSSNQWYSQCVN
ncbi:Acetylxylan esterase [Paramyrothecium foliicola]|nr:Acetylxylan esterase [Paramyrothecium foliicola]